MRLPETVIEDVSDCGTVSDDVDEQVGVRVAVAWRAQLGVQLRVPLGLPLQDTEGVLVFDTARLGEVLRLADGDGAALTVHDALWLGLRERDPDME